MPLKTEHVCTECGSERTHLVQKRVPHKNARRRTVAAMWYQCLDCWHKFHGVTVGDNGILPAGVKRREGYIE
jgi:DNA-directed RNA polymerase subunit RPC12/RpoP